MDTTRTDNDGTRYFFNKKHRDGSPDKSQWRINYELEFSVFCDVRKRKWITGLAGWGFYFENHKITYLGVAQDHYTRVFIAKFVRDPNHNLWHGYPADHQADSQHIPDEEVREQWIIEGILPEAKIRKIGKGQPCKL